LQFSKRAVFNSLLSDIGRRRPRNIAFPVVWDAFLARQLESGGLPDFPGKGVILP
jgi:hypothetical protein